MASTSPKVAVGILLVTALFGAHLLASANRAHTPRTGGDHQRADSVERSDASTTVSSVPSSGLDFVSVSRVVAGGCCGIRDLHVSKNAAIRDGVQRIAVDVSAGFYNPSVIKLKAGIPTEITFGRSDGCTRVVQSSDLHFKEDLRAGSKTIKLKRLVAGTYEFACGMDMVAGKIEVQ
jgi:hypothetical protein